MNTQINKNEKQAFTNKFIAEMNCLPGQVMRVERVDQRNAVIIYSSAGMIMSKSVPASPYVAQSYIAPLKRMFPDVQVRW